MRLTKYRMELNEDGINQLVKEETRLYKDISRIRSPKEVVEMMNTVYRLDKMAEEYAYEIAMNAKGKVLGVFEISHGATDYTLMSAREVMKRALLVGSINVIIVHNHPSGVVEPSREDIAAAKKLVEAGKILEIRVSDFIVIGESGTYESFNETGVI